MTDRGELRLISEAGRLAVGDRFREDGRVWRVVAIEDAGLGPKSPARRYVCAPDPVQDPDVPTLAEREAARHGEREGWRFRP